jgi:hypothetical protein
MPTRLSRVVTADGHAAAASATVVLEIPIAASRGAKFSAATALKQQLNG